MSQFVKFTSRETGGELFLRRDMIAAVGSYWKGVTHVTLINEDIDFEVKESVREALALITGEKVPDGSLTSNNQCGIIRGQRRNHAHRHSQDKREIPAGSRETPAAVPPVVHDAPPVL